MLKYHIGTGCGIIAGLENNLLATPERNDCGKAVAILPTPFIKNSTMVNVRAGEEEPATNRSENLHFVLSSQLLNSDSIGQTREPW